MLNILGNDKKLADVEITVKDKIILIEAKGISPDIPTENDCSQISKYIKRKSSKFTDNRIFGVFIVNHDNKKFFNLRNPNPFDQTRIEDAKISDYGLMTTYDLFKYYLEIKKHTISLNEFENIICKKGLIKYKKMARKTPITT